jgi:hypothetical protein
MSKLVAFFIFKNKKYKPQKKKKQKGERISIKGFEALSFFFGVSKSLTHDVERALSFAILLSSSAPIEFTTSFNV